ncbi:MAG: UDP-N-acetylmuramate dehydrogenase [Myxococcota bacterium]
MALRVLHNVPLASRTSFGLGGQARNLVEIHDEPTLAEALHWAERHQQPVFVLGGGSNVVIADEGWPGLVIHMKLRGIQTSLDAQGVQIRVAAGEPWDDLVAWTVAEGWAGLECLSGIPGSTGATPIQNVGAYGQEISEVISAVHGWDRRTGQRCVISPDDCGFGYRHSRFKEDPQSMVILGVEFMLRPGGLPTLRYAELRRCFSGQATPPLAEVRAQVLELRRSKSMVIEPDDPNRRSAGSFFTNPVVETTQADAVVAQAVREGLAADAEAVPRYPTQDGRVKIPAAWLIEAAGFRKGQRDGPVGLSTRHALAVVHHGGGTTAQLVAFAQKIQRAVRERFGVELRPEPVFVGVGVGVGAE